MILTLKETKNWIRVDFDEDDQIIEMLIIAAEDYLKNATGKEFSSDSALAKLFCLVLITEWYDDRKIIGQVTEKIRHTVTSILAQLEYAEGVPDA